MTLPFLHELMSLNEKNVRKEKAQHICSKYATQRYIQSDADGFDEIKHHLNGWGSSASSHVSCVFGQFSNSWENFGELPKYHRFRKDKSGIEILNAQPNATGSTYSNKCLVTVKELKEACKANGIKPKGDKRALLRTLMNL
jgi:hypothetical protein